MKVIHIPVDDRQPIRLLELGYDVTYQRHPFEPSLVEHVRFGRTERGLTSMFTDEQGWYAVLLVDENGMREGGHLNRRATTLYRSGVHDGVIVGEAYLVMEERQPEDYVWHEPTGPYAEPDFWMEVADA